MPRQTDKPVMIELVGNEQARGIELALTPVVFGVIGWLIDRGLGTGPWFAVGLAAFALFATVVKIWFGYDAEMRELESSSRWARGARPAPTDDGDLWGDRKAQA